MAGKPVPVVRDVYGFGTKRAKVSLTRMGLGCELERCLGHDKGSHLQKTHLEHATLQPDVGSYHVGTQCFTEMRGPFHLSHGAQQKVLFAAGMMIGLWLGDSE